MDDVSRFRFTIAQLLAVVVFVAIGFAALRNATPIWVGATFSLAIISVSVAFACAWTCKDESRVPWASFAIAGGLCLVIGFLTPAGNPSDPPGPLLDQLRSFMHPVFNDMDEFIAQRKIASSLDVLLLGSIAAFVGHVIAAKRERRNS
jgi:hypothetical protein